jgi:filamentous hemagglutinin family protein
VGKQTKVDLNQSGNTNSVVLNEIEDPTLAPSEIICSIKASGGIYIINQDGVIFIGSSQVNVRTLIACAMALNNLGYQNF